MAESQAESAETPILDSLEDASRDLEDVPKWALPGVVFPPGVTEKVTVTPAEVD